MSNNSNYKEFTDQWMQSWEYLDRNQRSMNAVFEMCFNDGKFHISLHTLQCLIQRTRCGICILMGRTG